MEDRAIQTLKSILSKRNVTVEQVEPIGNPLDETRMYSLGGVLTIFSEKSRVSDTDLNKFIDFANENGYTNGTIVVSMSSPSDKVVNVVRDYIKDRRNPLLQLFELRKLQIDISQHRMVPSHRLLTDAEKTKLEERFNLTDLRKQLPWIDSQDAMAKVVGARPDDVIEVVRFSETSGATTAYRYCVANVLDS